MEMEMKNLQLARTHGAQTRQKRINEFAKFEERMLSGIEYFLCHADSREKRHKYVILVLWLAELWPAEEVLFCWAREVVGQCHKN